jgi:hypothetical protein
VGPLSCGLWLLLGVQLLEMLCGSRSDSMQLSGQ